MKTKIASRISGPQFIKVIRIADWEWQGILRLGRYCGISLRSCSRLRWSNVSRDNCNLNLFSHGTGRMRSFPLGPKLTDYLATIRCIGEEDGFVFPRNCRKSVASLATDFARLANKAWGNQLPRVTRFSSIQFSLKESWAGGPGRGPRGAPAPGRGRGGAP